MGQSPDFPFIMAVDHSLRHHHLRGDVDEPLRSIPHDVRHKLVHHLGGSTLHNRLDEGIIALGRHRPLSNKRQLRLDTGKVPHHDGEQFFAPFLEERPFHVVKNGVKINRLGARLDPPGQPVVTASRLGVADDFIGGVDSSDGFLGFAASGIAVGMMLQNQLPVSFFNVVVRSLPRDAQNSIVIHPCHGGDYSMGRMPLHVPVRPQTMQSEPIMPTLLPLPPSSRRTVDFNNGVLS